MDIFWYYIGMVTINEVNSAGERNEYIASGAEVNRQTLCYRELMRLSFGFGCKSGVGGGSMLPIPTTDNSNTNLYLRSMPDKNTTRQSGNRGSIHK